MSRLCLSLFLRLQGKIRSSHVCWPKELACCLTSVILNVCEAMFVRLAGNMCSKAREVIVMLHFSDCLHVTECLQEEAKPRNTT